MSTQTASAPPPVNKDLYNQTDTTGIQAHREAILEELRTTPGKWGVLSTHKTAGSARTVKNRIKSRMSESERKDWSTAVRTNEDGSATLWACFRAETAGPDREAS